MTDSQDITNFWFKELSPADWFAKSDTLDEEIKTRFGEIHKKAAQDELTHWRETPQGKLAEIIILDQFSRNMFRDSAQAFAQDNMALELSKEAIKTGDDKSLTKRERSFLYMPFMHSEDMQIHEQAIQIFTELGDETNLKYEKRHKEIIERFGRYPHRNAVLDRKSTPEEIEFLKQEGSSF